MGWDNEYYLHMMDKFRKEISIHKKKEYFELYDKMVEDEEYEAAKAIKDILLEITEYIKKTNEIIKREDG